MRRALLAIALVLTVRSAAVPGLCQTAEATVTFAPTELEDSEGNRQSLANLVGRDQPVVISFTYAGCTAICPISDQIMDVLAQETEGDTPRAVLITLTIDPFNDTPAALKKRAADQRYSDARLWLSGDPRNVFAALDSLGFQFGDVDQHPQTFIVVGPQARWMRRVNGQASPSQLLALLRHGP